MGWLNKLFNLDSFKSGESTPYGNTSYKKPSTPSYASVEAGAQASGSSASKRLKLVLMHDRTQLSPAMMEQMRDELVEVISKYVEIDKDALDINLESESNTIALVANIPVLRARVGVAEELLKKSADVATAKADAEKTEVKTPEKSPEKSQDELDKLLEKAVEEAEKEQAEKSGASKQPATGTAGT